MKKSYFVMVLLVSALILSNCNLQIASRAALTPSANPTELAQAVLSTFAAQAGQSTALAQTVQVAVSATSGAAPSDTPQPSATSTKRAATASSNSSVSTPTPPPTLTVGAATRTPVPVPCNAAAFVRDVTIADNTTIGAGNSFVKTWRLLNTGSCTWNTNYRLIFDHGSQMGGPDVVDLPANVSPGHTIDLSVSLKAPTSAGTYTGYWELESSSGSVFGVGASGGGPFFVRIRVGTTAGPFAVTSITMSVDTSSVTTACPAGHTFKFKGKIQTNTAGTVTYHWQFSDGTVTSDTNLSFNSASTQTVTRNWTLGGSGPLSSNPFHGWARIYINQPNHQYFGKVNITLNCS